MYGYSDKTAEPRVTAITVAGLVEAAPFDLPETGQPAAPDRQPRRAVFFPKAEGT